MIQSLSLGTGGSIAVAFTGAAAKKSMKFSAETFALFTAGKDSQMDRPKKPNFEGKGTDLVFWEEIKASQNAKIKATA